MTTQGQDNYGGASGKDDGGLTTGGDGREEMAQAQNQVPRTAGIENRAATDGLPNDDVAGDGATEEEAAEGAQMQSAMDADGAGGNPLDDSPESGSMGTDITGGSGMGGLVSGDAAGAVGSDAITNAGGATASGDAMGAAAGADIDPQATTPGSDMSDQTPGYGNMAGYDTTTDGTGGAPAGDGTSGMSSEGMNSGGAGAGSASYGGQGQGGQQQGGQSGSQQQGGFKTQGEREGEGYSDDLGDGASASSAGGGL